MVAADEWSWAARPISTTARPQLLISSMCNLRRLLPDTEQRPSIYLVTCKNGKKNSLRVQKKITMRLYESEVAFTIIQFCARTKCMNRKS
jgi:hypothetical protein